MARVTSAISRLRLFSVAWSFVPCAFIPCPHSCRRKWTRNQYLGQNEQSLKARQWGSTMLDAVRQFAGAKYLNLETFRRTGIDVRTPVWFAEDILHSAPSTLKMRRMRKPIFSNACDCGKALASAAGAYGLVASIFLVLLAAALPAGVPSPFVGRRTQAKLMKSLQSKERSLLPRHHREALPPSRASAMRSQPLRQKMICRLISSPG